MRNKLSGPVKPLSAGRPNGTSQDILTKHQSHELFVAIVGPAGAGAGTAARILESFLKDGGYETTIIKASSLIKATAERANLTVPPEGGRKSIESIKIMQDRGDDLREGTLFNCPEDHSAVARLIIHEISRRRAQFTGTKFTADAIIYPDEKKRAYIIDSLRHPAEVALLRRVYQEAFSLLGIVCEPEVRERRIRENMFDRNAWGTETARKQTREFLDRDESAPQKYGQHVADTFHEADFFVDNTEDGNDDLKITGMNDDLRRFVDLLSHEGIIRPYISETAMHHARSAQMRSACLSRQVGAAIVDVHGNIVATGTNEVPKAGGGVYGANFNHDFDHDHRCAFRESKFCSNNREQNSIILELVELFPNILINADKDQIVKQLRGTRIGGLIEFSRAVHAEMDAILSASRSGVSPVGCRLYVTTYPCHYCARHIVAAGIDEVQYIEPYPKSRASALHGDSITTDSKNWSPSPSNGEKKVLFRPFVGVAPRLYRRVFLKDRDYKDSVTGDIQLAQPKWGRDSDIYRLPYAGLEKELRWAGESDE